jgi:hypothetical protein
MSLPLKLAELFVPARGRRYGGCLDRRGPEILLVQMVHQADICKHPSGKIMPIEEIRLVRDA